MGGELILFCFQTAACNALLIPCLGLLLSTGEVGLLVCKITRLAPFSGYAGAKSQTEKKKLKDVFQKGDVYFNSGDLLMIDRNNFIYFHDRVGDTFRCVWHIYVRN